MAQPDLLFFSKDSQLIHRAGPVPAFHLAVIGNYPPSRCGLATFTADMVASLGAEAPAARIDLHAVVDDAAQPVPGATGTISKNLRAAYRAGGIRIAASAPDAVWVQHEFGLFGGEAGEWLLECLAPIAAPLVVTLHTILDQPSPAQRRVIDWLIARASRLVAMSEHGRQILIETYQADPARVSVIHHGVPERPFGRSAAMKRALDLEGRQVLLTFGLLSPGKGIETAIAALPAICAAHPQVRYVIAGATHPNVAAREGEAYRERLKAQAERLGVSGNIRWIDCFLETEALLDLIEAADIYLTPYPGAAQSTSGTLSYAVALGKAVVSTPYVHARELLADDHGVLFPFGDSAALGRAVLGLLDDPLALAAMQARAYRRGREATWPQFAQRTIDVIEAVKSPRHDTALPRLLSATGLERMCDSTGMLQHAVHAIPDRAHGYCIDDNARALMLANQLGGSFGARADSFAAFVQHGWNPARRRFRNFMDYGRNWLETEGSEDSCGRTLWALGATCADGETATLRHWAAHLWQASSAMAAGFGSPRALAFAMLGADRRLEADPGDTLAAKILADGAARLDRLLADASRPGWTWFEPVLAYDNCRLPEALLRASIRLGDQTMTARALAALDWIARQQTSPAGQFRPVGSTGFGTGDLPPAPFDQQPVDAWATVDAAACAYRHTGDARWRGEARRAFAWFFGANDRGLALTAAETGSCRDGVNPHGLNLNEGAESVLSLHLAWCTMALLEGWVGETQDRDCTSALSVAS